jgi:CheY-like chemotaxis protein
MTPTATILLLDDEPMLRRATSVMLANRGGRVSAAATPDEAVALAEARVFDVAIFDLSHGGPSASEVLHRIRAGGLVPRRVIAVTDAPLPRHEAEQFSEVLTKPYPFDRLLRAVFGAQGRRRTRSGIFASTKAPATASAPAGHDEPAAEAVGSSSTVGRRPPASAGSLSASTSAVEPSPLTLRSPRRDARASRGRG